MKKMKLFLLAAMIFGAASAFTTVKHTETLWVLAPNHVDFITEDVAINEFGGTCQSFPPEKCTYTAPNSSSPDPDGLDGRYQY